jgi:crotonobetainyl-CoA:carnitine CoA-transferase CaiB-like acyl-CoA transferase
LSHSATAALVNVAQNVLVSGADARRWGNAHPNLVPYQLFHASDRGIVIAVGSDQQWRACCAALGLSQLAGDESLASNAGRLANRTRVTQAIERRVGERRAADWVEALGKAGVPSGVIRTPLEALSGGEHSARTGVVPPPPGAIRLPPPRLDEHGDLVRSHGWRAFEHLG